MTLVAGEPGRGDDASRANPATTGGWAGVELRDLAVLAAVAEEQSFRAAAERLGYMQSAVSKRIARLEQAVGVRLVERSSGRGYVALTDAGRTLLHHARRIQDQLDAARADLRSSIGDPESEHLSVGAFGSLAARLVPGALARMAERAPATTVEIREAPSDHELFAAVHAGHLDAAFAELPLQPGPFAWRELLVDPLVLVVPAGSPLAAGPSPPVLSEIAARPFVVNSSWRMFRLVETTFATAGLRIDVRFTATSNAAVQALVAAGLGVAIAPRLATDGGDPATEAVELSDVLPPRTLVCYWRRDRLRNPALDVFLEAMSETCARLRDVRSKEESVRSDRE